MPRGSHLALALAASLLLHTVLIFGLPRGSLKLLDPVEQLVEVELAEPEPLPIAAPAPPKTVETPKPADLPKPPEPVQPQPPVPSPPPAEQPVRELKTPEEVSRALRGEPPSPGDLPRRAQPVTLPRRKPLALTADELAVEPVQPRPPPGTLGAPDAPGMLPRAGPRPDGSLGDLEGAGSEAEALLTRLEKSGATGAGLADVSPGALPEIGGEVGRERIVLHHPEPPRVEIQNPATVEMEFWVSSTGAVVRVRPLRRGEPALDRAAMDYVKQFQFNPLPDGRRPEQRGTIRVRFLWR